MSAISSFFRDLLTGAQTLNNGSRAPKMLRHARNAILSIILVVVALAAAIGSAWLSRSNFIISAALAGFALLLSLIISVTIVPRLARRARFELFSWKVMSQI